MIIYWLVLSILFYYISEIYEAQRWYSDPRYQAPMIISVDSSHIFTGDVVETPGFDNQTCPSHQIHDRGKRGEEKFHHFITWRILSHHLFISTIQKISGKLVADIRPIVTRRRVNIIHTTTITTPCDNLRPSTQCLSKDDTIIKDINSFRPITDKVI